MKLQIFKLLSTVAFNSNLRRYTVANLEGQGNFQGKIWGTFLPLNPGTDDPALARIGVSLLARDFQSVAVYASDGSFAGRGGYTYITIAYR